MLRLAVIGSVLVLAFAGAAAAHANGSWLAPADAAGKAATKAMPRLRCSGAGLAREVDQGSYNGSGQPVVLYRHFACVGLDGRGTARWRVCIHLLASGKLDTRSSRLPARKCSF